MQNQTQTVVGELSTPVIPIIAKGIVITLSKKSNPEDLLRSWAFNESIFEDRMYLSFNETGSMRLPIDVTGLVLKSYPEKDWNGRVKLEIVPK
ncbi:MAG: hypothetical protein R8G66_10765 [Cytophagales bacterium]|nr:hypothetical protein [Cytophagales bacterium]